MLWLCSLAPPPAPHAHAHTHTHTHTHTLTTPSRMLRSPPASGSGTAPEPPTRSCSAPAGKILVGRTCRRAGCGRCEQRAEGGEGGEWRWSEEGTVDGAAVCCLSRAAAAAHTHTHTHTHRTGQWQPSSLSPLRLSLSHTHTHTHTHTHPPPLPVATLLKSSVFKSSVKSINTTLPHTYA